MSRPGIKKTAIILVIVLFIAILGITSFWLLSLKAAEPAEQKVEVGPVYETEEFTVNLSNTLNHFIKARFAIELSNEKARKELEGKLPILQDKIIMVLSGQDLNSLSTVQGKEELKTALLNAINSILEKGQVNKIYFKNILFQ